MASSLAVWTVKLPEICALPPRIGSLMLGAERTTLSRMMANGLPTFSWVTRAKAWLPGLSKRMLTAGAPFSVEVLLGVGDLVAGDHRAALDRDPAAVLGDRQDLAADRGAARLRPAPA